MKVLYIGVYRDGTGYGQAAEDYILSLDSVGVDVVCRPLKLNNVNHEPNPIINKLESKSSKNCDIVIQHVLPIHMQYNGNFDYNIGLFAYETSNFKMSGWKNYLNLMDANIVINNQMITSCINSGVTTPLHLVPHARNFSNYVEKYEKLETITSQVSSSDFIFYTIGEMTKRKNFSALLKAYFTEFSESEPVCLFVKTNKSTYEFYDYCGKILDGLSIKNPPKVISMTERISDDDINRIHYTCDAFVQPSYGEAWSIPAFDAMAFGKTPIVTNCTGYREYIDDSVGWLVEGHDEPIFAADKQVDDIYTYNETWFSVDIMDLKRKMRECYEKEGIRRLKAQNALDRAYEFSYEKVGSIFLEVLKNVAKEKKTELVRRG